MNRLLGQDRLFFLLLVVSAIAHWAIGYLGGEEITAARLWRLENGKTTVSIQLVAAEAPPALEDVVPEMEPVESLARVAPPMEMPPSLTPDMEPLDLPREELEKPVDQQQAEISDSLLIERHSDFQLPPAVAIAVPEQDTTQTTHRIEFASADLRRQTESPLSAQPIEDDPLPAFQQPPRTAARTEHPDAPPPQEAVSLPRHQQQSQPENPPPVRLPENATRTVVRQGSTGAEVPPSIRNRRQPVYPQDLIAGGVEGRVMLRVDISETGQVLAMEIENSSGHPRLDQSAMAAVRDWRFVPGRRNGRPAPMTVIVPVSFQVVR
jgi:protein TonB